MTGAIKSTSSSSSSSSTRRKSLYPKSILNRSDLIKDLNLNSIKISSKQLDIFYHLIHLQDYPTLSNFVSWYYNNDSNSSSTSASKNKKVKKQLPKQFLQYINKTKDYVTLTSSVHSIYTTPHSSTTKLIIKLQDGHLIECVSMYYTNSRYTLCVSSQVGCAMGCTFCATGTMGIKGNVTYTEIVEQMIFMTNTLNKDNDNAQEKKSIRNIVYMGMGEPLNNYKNVTSSIKLYFQNNRLWSLRNDRITISTVGVTPSINKLKLDLPNVNLALSLHAPTQMKREEIVPTAKHYPLDELMIAFHTFASNNDDGDCSNSSNRKKKRRKGMIEYVLIGNAPTSSIESAHELGKLLTSTKTSSSSSSSTDIVVNLIPYNPTQSSSNELEHTKPSIDHIEQFKSIIQNSYGIPCYVRRTFGDDIGSACGQLVIDIEDSVHEEKKVDYSMPTNTANTSTASSTIIKSKKKYTDHEDKNDAINVVTAKKTISFQQEEEQNNNCDTSDNNSTTTTNSSSSRNLKWLIKPLTYATIITATCCIVSTGILLLTSSGSSTSNTNKKNNGGSSM